VNKNKRKIFIAGHNGMVGSAITKILSKDNVTIISKSHSELNLVNQNEVLEFFMNEKPDEVYLSAARVGGINANNKYPAEFIYQNLMIEANVIHSAFKAGVKKLLFLGSSCIYPKESLQPIKEKYLMTGLLEETNEPYAIAKISGIKLCESYNRQYGESHKIDYRSVMPTNLYGPNDNYHLTNSHVVPALIRRFHEAKINKKEFLSIWGSGTASREFLHVDDMAEACIFIMNLDSYIYKKYTKPMVSHVNIGSGYDITISCLANAVKKVVNYKGKINFDTSKPEGPQKKLVDSSLLNSWGWQPKIDFEKGLVATYEDFLSNQDVYCKK
jgi:GDP-L-fucose synthase